MDTDVVQSYFSHFLTTFLFCAQEMGVIGPNNQLPMRGAGRARGRLQSSLYDIEDDSWTNHVQVSRAKLDEQKRRQPPVEEASDIAEALSLFPQSKSLLTRVVQVATSSNKLKVALILYTMNTKHSLLNCV